MMNLGGNFCSEGLFEFDKNFKQLHQYRKFEGVYNFNENGIASLNETSDGEIMVCRMGGFSLIHPSTRRQNDFSGFQDFSYTLTINTLEDKQKNIWIGADSKLIRLDSMHKHFTVFTTSKWTYI